MWLRAQKEELKEDWLRAGPAMIFAIDVDSNILWANPCFTDWSKYSAMELRQGGCRRLSVSAESFAADMSVLRDVIDGFSSEIQTQIQLQPKNSQSEWGDLTLRRYPQTGQIEVFLCHWSPLKNGTATAFALAIEATRETAEAMKELAARVTTLSSTNEDEDFVIRAIRAARRHPKLAALIAGCVITLPAANQLRELTLWALGVKPVTEVIEHTEPTTSGQK